MCDPRSCAARLVPRHEHAGIRRRPYGDYLIFYRIGTDVIEVVHVLHGAQDYQAILFPEG
jgi:toxin ParE1/3/4